MISSLLLLFFWAVTLSNAVFALGPPPLEVLILPQSQDIKIGGSATFELQITVLAGRARMENFTLSAVSLPQGVSATFNPSIFTNTDESFLTSKMTVNVAEDAPQQKAYLNVQGIAIFYPKEVAPMSLKGGGGVILNIYAVPPVRTTTATTTSTVTNENIITQTVTSTSTHISTLTTTLSTAYTSTITTRLQDQAAEPPAYAWAVSATIASAVLAVILLRKRT